MHSFDAEEYRRFHRFRPAARVSRFSGDFAGYAGRPYCCREAMRHAAAQEKQRGQNTTSQSLAHAACMV
jgi:hypothetical protein